MKLLCITFFCTLITRKIFRKEMSAIHAFVGCQNVTLAALESFGKMISLHWSVINNRF